MLQSIFEYQSLEGKIPFREWLLSLKDRQARARIRARLDRFRLGNFGDCKSVGEGVFEMRFHFGPGYRVYFGVDGSAIVILLSGGDKATQVRDIGKAQEYWKDYLRRK